MNLMYKLLLLKEYKFEILLTLLLSIAFFFYKFLTNIETYKIVYDLSFERNINLNKVEDQKYLDFVKSIYEYKYLIDTFYINNSNLRKQIDKIVSNSLIVEMFDRDHHKTYRPLYQFFENTKFKNFKIKLVSYDLIGKSTRIRLYLKNIEVNQDYIDDIFKNHLTLINTFFNEQFMLNLNNNLKPLYAFHDSVSIISKNKTFNNVLKNNYQKHIEELDNKLIIIKKKFKDLTSLEYIYFIESNKFKVNKNIYFNHFLETLMLFLIISFLRRQFFNVK